MQVIDSIKFMSLIENIRIPANFDTQAQFFAEAKKALHGVDLSKPQDTKRFTVKTFLNRLLGCHVNIQNSIFEYFESALESEIILAKREGNQYNKALFNVWMSLSTHMCADRKLYIAHTQVYLQIEYKFCCTQ